MPYDVRVIQVEVFCRAEITTQTGRVKDKLGLYFQAVAPMEAAPLAPDDIAQIVNGDGEARVLVDGADQEMGVLTGGRGDEYSKSGQGTMQGPPQAAQKNVYQTGGFIFVDYGREG